MVDRQQIEDLEHLFRDKGKFEAFRLVFPNEIVTMLPFVYLEYSAIYGDMTDLKKFLQLSGRLLKNELEQAFIERV